MPESPKNRATSPSAPTFAEQCIGRTPCGGHQVVGRGEHGLLHLARVFGAADQHLLAFEIETDERLGVRPVAVGHSFEARGREDRELGLETLELIEPAATEQLPTEQSVPGALGDDAELDPVGRVGSDERRR